MKIPIVDENDNIICCKDRKDRLPWEITRITSLWLGNEKSEVLLAQRAFTKKVHPGLWGPAAAGSVEEGETYDSNVVKEAEEEIGLTGVEFIPWDKLRRSSSHEYFVQSYIAFTTSDYPLVKQDEEVEAIKWFSKEELFKTLNENPEIFLYSIKERAEEFFKYADKNKKN